MSASRVLVVGSGVIGLRTALELTRRQIPVVLRSPVHPLHPSNCSQGAGGLWMPFHCNDPRTHRWSMETLDEIYPMATAAATTTTTKAEEGTAVPPLVALRYALQLKRDQTGPDTDDIIADDYHLGTGGKSKLPIWSTDPRLAFQNVSMEQVEWQNWVHQLKLPSLPALKKAGYLHGWFFQTPVVDCPKMLQTMLDEIVNGGGNDTCSQQNDVNVETGVYYRSIPHLIDEARTLGCDAVVNCTGLGAASMTQDSELVGARGALLLYDSQTCVRRPTTTIDGGDQPEQLHDACIMIEEPPWGSHDYPCYMIPRGDDTIVVGGTYLTEDDEPQMRPEERKRLLENARLLGIDTDMSKPKGEWVGFRPYRSKRSRCELDEGAENGDIRLVHCYGTGGSGWTVYSGIAKEATRLVLQ